MAVLDQVMQLKGQGLQDAEIANKLKEQGVSPNEITTALDQARIKSAVSAGGESSSDSGQQTMQQEGNSQGEYASQGQGFSEQQATQQEQYTSPSGQGYDPQQYADQGQYAPQQDYSQGYDASQQQDYYSQDYGQQQGYDQQGYSQDYGQQDYGQTGSADTMIEIAEQVFEEKSKKMQKQIESFQEFKTLTQSKIENISDRLKRIESNIDKLQSEILERVGSYGRGIDGIKKEMSMMQDSFGKIVNTVADKAEEKKKSRSPKKK